MDLLINYGGFVSASILLNITPGTDTLYILSRSLQQGRPSGLAATAGIISGCAVHTLLAAFGIAALLKAYPIIYQSLLYAGAAYLLYAGWQQLASKQGNFAAAVLAPKSNRSIAFQGLWINVINPKMSLFFVAFLPQFVHPASLGSPLPYLLLGASFIFTGTAWCITVALGAGSFARVLAQKPKIGAFIQRACGILFIGFALKMVLA